MRVMRRKLCGVALRCLARCNHRLQWRATAPAKNDAKHYRDAAAQLVHTRRSVRQA